jgi:PDZ domain-containing protein
MSVDDPGPTGPPASNPGERRRMGRGAKVLVGMLTIVVAAIVAASLITIPYDALTPGTALNVGGLISVPAGKGHTHAGTVFLTDVELVLSMRAVQWPFFILDHDDQVEPAADVSGTADANQYQEQGVIDMAAARQAATVVALRAAGYKVSAKPAGVVDYQPIPGSPAARSLLVGDVITSIGGSPTLSYAALSAAVAARKPGTKVEIGLHFIGSSHTRSISLALGEAVDSSANATEGQCVAVGTKHSGVVVDRGGKPESCIGLYLEQIYATAGVPFAVSIVSEGIIGPSAGLAFTIGLLEKLDPADLTGGKRIAATGTMSINGDVGDVGGVAQKTVAVRDAGAVLFLVPPQELAVARAHAGPNLKVVAVSTIGQAISALEHIGGHLVTHSTT